jgi:hypothetical protein
MPQVYCSQCTLAADVRLLFREALSQHPLSDPVSKVSREAVTKSAEEQGPRRRVYARLDLTPERSPQGEATHFIVFVSPCIFFLRFWPKNRMSSLKPPNFLKQKQIELAF